ncbi:hypothetical protein [Streptomyces roseochromogenus]|uniref:Uncharacterized protein n=1 Tax=Streptomyces roseochromogenus subsp. oscitans DS 12.976 TaxID=1352936 RepID=V6JWR8_STRRC|nr:hypothetical protein [Streptomyces roseochromogenus]EST24365.1 hypothetical protein M878_30595 [Streptomyces roseochromogenus subsp. oscitans DS 12.976]
MSIDTAGIPAGPVQTGPVDFHPREEQIAILRDVLNAAGVELGAYDTTIVDWLAMWDWSTFAVVASWVARAAQTREPAPAVALPSRFDATPAEVDQHLRRIIAEDVYLRYQQTIGARAVAEAVKDVRLEVAAPDAPDAHQWRAVADYLDPDKGGNPYPSQLRKDADATARATSDSVRADQ